MGSSSTGTGCQTVPSVSWANVTNLGRRLRGLLGSMSPGVRVGGTCRSDRKNGQAVMSCVRPLLSRAPGLTGDVWFLLGWLSQWCPVAKPFKHVPTWMWALCGQMSVMLAAGVASALGDLCPWGTSCRECQIWHLIDADTWKEPGWGAEVESFRKQNRCQEVWETCALELSMKATVTR